MGHCCDKVLDFIIEFHSIEKLKINHLFKYPKTMPWFMFCSAVSSAISFSFLGPLPWFKLPLRLSIVLSGFVAFGFSLGGLVIPVYSQLYRIAL